MKTGPLLYHAKNYNIFSILGVLLHNRNINVQRFYVCFQVFEKNESLIRGYFV